eukprot:gnl/MRDRNA2_/MRDRNA2_183748_c0_seq1.p1 gnl/MRDRNA2_/MRDRNA2_183748_c0~~gnl/MRDRNA2_/MRDRNA2_183748_c0_seq1.p1  ORF type:complete len:335 (+),score=43.99 gnl/MRDRNA2_/MRDRNA2_183748_c0_seq1:119-1006(+)
MAKNSNQNVFSFSCQYLSDMAAIQNGVRLPIVRPFGMYVYTHYAPAMFPNPFKTVDQSAGEFSRSIIVPRSLLAMTTSFLHALSAFADSMEPEFPFKFVAIRSTSKPLEGDIDLAVNPPIEGQKLKDVLKRDANVFIEMGQMLLYRAAIFLPQSPNMMSLYEFHTLHLPIFIPSCDWMYRLYHQRKWIPPSTGRLLGTGGRTRRMKTPMTDEEVWGTNDTYLLWVFLFDRRFETHMPGVGQFDNFAHLLKKLLYTDFVALRERMRKHNEENFKPILQWYRSAVLHLIGGLIEYRA